jgi:hypothetical protein
LPSYIALQGWVKKQASRPRPKPRAKSFPRRP